MNSRYDSRPRRQRPHILAALLVGLFASKSLECFANRSLGTNSASLVRENTHSAASCTNIDFRPRLGKPRSQGKTYYCFAYGTAIMINQRTGLDVSALDLATTFYFDSARKLAQTSNPVLHQYLLDNPNWFTAINEARAEVDIAPTLGRSGQLRERPFFHSLQGGTEEATVLLANDNDLCLDKDFPSDPGLSVHRKVIDEFEKEARQTAPRFTVPVDLSDVIPKFRDPVSDLFNIEWLTYRERSCHRVKSPVPLIPIGYNGADTVLELREKIKSGEINADKENSKLFTLIDQAIDRDRVPAIGYDYFMTGPRDESERDLTGDHSAAIVARRFGNDQCEYLVRDPSGTECSEYYSPFKERCHAGEFWIHESEMKGSLFSVVYLR